jgi:hypothetical protein
MRIPEFKTFVEAMLPDFGPILAPKRAAGRKCSLDVEALCGMLLIFLGHGKQQQQMLVMPLELTVGHIDRQARLLSAIAPWIMIP